MISVFTVLTIRSLEVFIGVRIELKLVRSDGWDKVIPLSYQ